MRALALLAGGSLALLLATAACDGARKPPFLPEASPSATAEATPTAAATPTKATPASLDSFRTFAQQIEAAVRGQDAEFFLGIAKSSTIVCPSEFESRCGGQPDGTQIQGVWFGRWRSEGSLLTSDEMRATITAYLNSLADPALHAIGRREGAGLVGQVSFFAVVVSSEQPVNSTYVFEFVPSGVDWRFASVMEAPVLAEEWLFGECGDCYDQWERWEGNP